ncbi:MAG: helix-turn-helix domain-containing protein, partial [Polyangiaceae bacterium]
QHARVACRDAPDAALEAWKGLVSARWSLVEHFESDGKEYILACRNDPDVRGPAALTRREQQVLGLLGVGHTTKLVAYELGISDSTVRVLLARAMAKLGASTREEALAAFRDQPGPR